MVILSSSESQQLKKVDETRARISTCYAGLIDPITNML
jgi:hypothetical protein